MTAADATHRLPAGLMGESWPATCSGAVLSLGRALGSAGSVLLHAAALGPSRIRCLIVGHADRLSRQPGRLALTCNGCGRSTTGWAIARSAAAGREASE